MKNKNVLKELSFDLLEIGVCLLIVWAILNTVLAISKSPKAFWIAVIPASAVAGVASRKILNVAKKAL